MANVSLTQFIHKCLTEIYWNTPLVKCRNIVTLLCYAISNQWNHWLERVCSYYFTTKKVSPILITLTKLTCSNKEKIATFIKF